jgi:vacuolar transporter chaperone complex subunit 4
MMYPTDLVLSVDTDILKPDTGAAHFERPSSTVTSNSPHARTPQPYTEPLSEGEEDEELAIDIARDEDKIAGLDPAAATEAISYREIFLQQKAHEDEEKKKRNAATREYEEDASSDDERTAFLKRRKSSVTAASRPRTRTLSIDPLTPASFFDKRFKSSIFRGRQEPDSGSAPLNEAEEPHDDDEPLDPDLSTQHGEIQYLREWRAQDGKKIAVPVRIEPKVYFAAERTFLVRFYVVRRRVHFSTSHSAGYNLAW